MYLTHLESRIWISSFHIYFKKWFFGLQNSIVPLKCRGKKLLSTLNVMILQMVKNECVKFGGHVNIEVSYKILQLDVLKKTHVCKIHLALNRGCFETVLMKNTPRTLGVNYVTWGVGNFFKLYTAFFCCSKVRSESF
jgi:hypothetical protein